MTFYVDAKIRQCAIQLQDFRLLGKLSEGELIATEACYKCTLLGFIQYSITAFKNTEIQSESDMNLDGVVFRVNGI